MVIVALPTRMPLRPVPVTGPAFSTVVVSVVLMPSNAPEMTPVTELLIVPVVDWMPIELAAAVPPAAEIVPEFPTLTSVAAMPRVKVLPAAAVPGMVPVLLTPTLVASMPKLSPLTVPSLVTVPVFVVMPTVPAPVPCQHGAKHPRPAPARRAWFRST